MKVGIFADIHGNLPAFSAVLPFLTERCESLIFLGDLVGYYPFASGCLELWDKKRIHSIVGNHDQVLIEAISLDRPIPSEYTKSYGNALQRTRETFSKDEFEQIKNWPQTLSLEIDGKKFQMFHGAPWDFLDGRVYPSFEAWDKFDSLKVDVVLLGHTHYAFAKSWGCKWIVNPGSVGQPRDKGGGACCAILDTQTLETEFYRLPYENRDIILDAEKNNPKLPYLTEVFKR